MINKDKFVILISFPPPPIFFYSLFLSFVANLDFLFMVVVAAVDAYDYYDANVAEL